MSVTIERTMYTPPQLAAMTGLDEEKFHAWIKSGELLAMNAATKVGQRPRYLIALEDWEIFKRSRMVVPAEAPVRRKKPTTPPGFVRNFR